MSVDTRNNIIAIIAAVTLGAVLIVSLIGILVLAAVHDGELANHALDTFNQIIVVVIPAIAALAGIDKLVTGITAGKSIAAAASVGVAQASNGVPVTTPVVPVPPVAPVAAVDASSGAEGVSSPSGVSLPSDTPSSSALDSAAVTASASEVTP